jgi:C-terminal processing protease CtpA/Prc
LVKENEMYEAYGHLHEGGFNSLPTPIFSSKLHNIFTAVRTREAAAIQTVNAAGMGGDRLRLSGFIKIEQFTPGANAQLWLRGDRDGRHVAFALTTNDNPAMKNEWQKFVIETDTLPEDILNLRIGLVMIGDGKSLFDDIKLESMNSGEIIEIRNAGFETSMNNDAITGWFVPGTVYNAGYKVETSAAEKNTGNYSLEISTDENTAPNFPALDRIFEIALDDNLILKFPALSGADESGKLKSAGSMRIPERIYPEGFYPVIDDRSSRLAIVIDMWSAIQQFSLENIEKQTLDSALTSCLAKAALDDDRNKFETTLNSLASLTHDSQCRVWQSGVLPEASLPVLLKYVDGKILVTSVAGDYTIINPGDELVMIDGKGARDYLDDMARFIPAANSSWAYARAIAQFRSGKKGSETNLKFKGPAGDVKEVTLVRNRRMDEVTESRPEVFSEVADSVAYLDLTYIDDRAFKEIAPELKDSKAIVFDLRGQTRMSEHFLGFFLEKPVEFLTWKIPAYTMPGKESNSFSVIKGQIDGRNLMPDKKLLFLCDERTSGYADAILWAVQYYGLGEIIGSPTAGSPGETIAYRLPGMFNFTMTSVEGYLPDGKSIFGKPVIPGFEIYPEPASLSESGDLQLRKALELAAQ